MSKGHPPKDRSPQEKKALSLKKDRRNTYGESPHGARKSIPKTKALAQRATRHGVKQDLHVLDRLPETVAETLESSAAKDVRRLGRWRKSPDEPLGEVLVRDQKRRGLITAAKPSRRANSDDGAS